MTVVPSLLKKLKKRSDLCYLAFVNVYIIRINKCNWTLSVDVKYLIEILDFLSSVIVG